MSRERPAPRPVDTAGGADDAADGPGHGIGLGEATRVWGLVALNSFGGPAGQIAVMHRFLIEDRRWFSEKRFLHSLNYCMLLPGPEAQQLATYFGWLLHGVPGGLIAGGLFVLPGFVAIMILSVLYAGFGDVAAVEAIFYGIKPAVMAIVAAAVVRIGSRALKNRTMYAIAAAAFVAIFFLDIPFPFIIAGAGILGYLGGRRWPDVFNVIRGHTGDVTDDERARISDDDQPVKPSTGRSLKVLAIGLTLWFAPILALALWTGRDSIWVQQGTFFSTAAVVTFGGAYSVLAYLAQQAVQTYGWLLPGEMLDGLGMAETTPGPLIQVVQFVGFMGAYRAGLGIDPMLAGALAAILVTWVTFVPCFLWIFLGAPYIEYLRGNHRLTSALSAITAAVVGVVLNLAVWFSLHTLFGQVGEVHAYGVRLYTPELASLDPYAAAIAAAAFLAMFKLRWPMLRTLAVSAVAGALLHYLIIG
jgi:chromate transporter